MSLSSIYQKYSKIKNFVGSEVATYSILSIFSGFFLFCVESSFIIVIQGFLLNLGILSADAVKIPRWYPTSLKATLLFLILFGFLRMSAFGLKTFISNVVGEIFKCYQREKITAYSLIFSEEISTASAINLFTQAANRAGESLNGILNSTQAFIAALCYFILGLKIAPFEMLAGVIGLAILSLPVRWLDSIFKRVGFLITQHWEYMMNAIINGIRHGFYLKIYGKVNEEIEKGKQSLKEYKHEVKVYHLANSLKVSLPIFLGIIIVASISFIGVKTFKTSGPTLVAFFYIFIRFTQTLTEIFAGPISIKLNMSSILDLYKFDSSMEERIKERSHKTNLSFNQEEQNLIVEALQKKNIQVDVQNVSFRYPNKEFQDDLFQNINLKIGKGDCLVITGASGSGKSTFLALLLGVHKPTMGRITLNNWNIEEVRSLLFKHTAYVGPDPFLIPGTILENLLYGHPAPSSLEPSDIEKALRTAQIWKFIETLPLKQNTFLNETAKISTGQKQRLSIARALLRKPAILILDEATANLDSETEKEIITILAEMMTHWITIVVTHKNSFDAVATQKLELATLQK